ncbi:MAG: hypothetical protein E6I42_02615 [Chloroflexi bacterium]|nr:MAG: hypothetical protein E6I42_02615 [Chloroflexota bacterium]
MRTIAVEEHFVDPRIRAATQSSDWARRTRELGEKGLRLGTEVFRSWRIWEKYVQQQRGRPGVPGRGTIERIDREKIAHANAERLLGI